jgi:hypothetical protein
MQTIRTIAVAAATGALALAPAAVDAHPRDGHKPKKAKRCVVKPAFFVKGTVTAFTADDPGTPGVNEASVTIRVTGANSHARNSGELADQDSAEKGVQVKGASYVADASSDAYRLVLSGYESGESPEAGDKVRALGKIELTRKRCARNESLADRYGDVDLKRVRLIDED